MGGAMGGGSMSGAIGGPMGSSIGGAISGVLGGLGMDRGDYIDRMSMDRRTIGQMDLDDRYGDDFRYHGRGMDNGYFH